MTVQELLDRLMLVKDKSLPVRIEYYVTDTDREQDVAMTAAEREVKCHPMFTSWISEITDVDENSDDADEDMAEVTISNLLLEKTDGR